MKKVSHRSLFGFPAILSAVLISCVMVSCENAEDDCIDESLINPGAVLPNIYDPVCGCNDVSYSNSYEAEANGVTSYTEGACEEDTEGCENGVPATVFNFDNTTIIQLEDGSIYHPISVPDDFVLMAGQNLIIEYTPLDILIYPPQMTIECIELTGTTECSPITMMGSDDDFLPNDPIEINSATIEGDCLFLSVSHSGGCEEHLYELVEFPLFCGTPPLPPTMLQLRHDANNDYCEAYITTMISFDLSNLQIEGENSIDISLMINGDTNYNESLTYLYE